MDLFSNMGLFLDIHSFTCSSAEYFFCEWQMENSVTEIHSYKRGLDLRLKRHEALKLSTAIFITSVNKNDQLQRVFFFYWLEIKCREYAKDFF